MWQLPPNVTVGPLMWQLATKFDLMATDASIEAAAAHDEGLWSQLDCIKVFARMSPQGKAKVIRMLQVPYWAVPYWAVPC
jgi:hypothetical protein